jgi:hypothetical protein
MNFWGRMADAFYKFLFDHFIKKNNFTKAISSGMFFTVFAGNTAIFKRKGHTEKERVPYIPYKMIRTSK